jgi:hypothetical protein
MPRPCARSSSRGQAPAVPDARLSYGQVVKARKRRRLLSLTRRAVFGVAESIAFTAVSTPFVERPNGTVRQPVAALHRKARLCESYYSLCLRRGILKGRSPARAAALTNHVWALRELLTFNAAVTS